MLVLCWLALSLESAAWLALLVLLFDGLGWWSPLLPSEPATRLGWVAAFSALSAAGRLVERYLRPPRP
jgi:hypothetical protein